MIKIMVKIRLKLIAVFLIYTLMACNNDSVSNSDKEVETIQQTSECILGEWEQEDKVFEEGVTARITFFDPNSVDNTSNSGNFKIQGYDKNNEIKKDKTLEGSWNIDDIGRLTLRINSNVWDVKLIKCGRMVLQKNQIYIKIKN